MPKRKRLNTDEGKDDEGPRRKRKPNLDSGNICQELYDVVRNYKAEDGRLLCENFIRAPKRRTLADYYEVVTTPMDMLKIQQKLKTEEYADVDQMTADFELMINNAKIYYKKNTQEYKDACELWEVFTDAKNELVSDDQQRASDGGSESSVQRSEDASALRKIILCKKAEIDQRKLTPAKSSERIRAKRLAVHQKWSSITAALQYESDADDQDSRLTAPSEAGDEVGDCDEGNDSSPEDADSNPQWQLYETVRNYQNPQGYQLSEPFLRLPSRRTYPDYYKEIKHPIALLRIRTKIKAGHYHSTMEVVDDLNLMFENAKKYNRPDSKIFKDAVKLQKIMQAKAREIIDIHLKESDSESEADDRRRKAKKSSPTAAPIDPKRPRKSLDGEPSVLKKRMKTLYKTLIDYVDESGRSLVSLFMEKPSRKNYPDYYEIIANPVDMKTIEANIKADKYQSEDALLADFKLMFNNCRQYNEERSQIYQDAETLEQVLYDKLRELGPFGKGYVKKTDLELASQEGYVEKPRGRFSNILQQKLFTLYETIKEYTDNKGRKLSQIFMKLPSKSGYPDYYEVIKRPLDMERIGSRMKNGLYESLDDMLADFVLMFDNACKYNEPDSQIYKDALILQRIAMQTKVELSEDLEGVPDVRMLVQELLTNLFTSVYNHQDEEGRCYSDSLVEFLETEVTAESQIPEVRPLNLDNIKRNLDRGRYRRLDHFQEDMFEVFERCRHASRTDSQVFEDSIEMQSYFIKLRDELCKNGEVLLSPALQYAEADLLASVEALKAEKVPQEQLEAEMEPRQEKEEKNSTEISTSDSVIFKDMTIYVGDFVYIEPREKGMEPHIIHVEKIWRDSQGEQWLYGCWFYRPNETFHLATRKFLQKEVFKSDNYNSTPLNQVLGKCYVLFVKDYFKSKPVGFNDEDVYVCESRYSAKAKAFKKIKIWGLTPTNPIEVIPREELLSPVRVPSVFKDGVERPKEEPIDYDDGDLQIIEKPRPNVICEVLNGEEGVTYYEQFTIPSGTFKLGDCGYVRTESERNLIGRIDKMWVDKDGNAFFHGPWFVTPQEIQHPPTRLFYRQEVFLSSIEDTNPLLSIVGKCAVLDYKDYVTRRPTEIKEEDVYICESRYYEAEHVIRKLPKGLRKFNLSSAVAQDEFYFFRKPLNPQKSEVVSATFVDRCPASGSTEPLPLTPRMSSETENEESNDLPPLANPKEETGTTLTSGSTSKKKSQKRLVTGYIIFASEVRKGVVIANPDLSFGEISRMIGTEWRNLPATQKTEYEERAQKQNEEFAAKEALENPPQSPASSAHAGSKNDKSEKNDKNSDAQAGVDKENVVYECQWDTCDFQYEDQQDLLEHLVGESVGHVHQTYQANRDTEFQCLWQNCARIKKNVPPFPNIQRLMRHLKEVHMKTTAKSVPPENRGRNFVPSRRGVSSPCVNAAGNGTNQGNLPVSQSRPYPPPSLLGNSSGMQHNYVAHQHQLRYYSPTLGQDPPAPLKPAEPMFVSVPPRTPRLLHSSTYIKYIEGLQPNSKYISNWDAQLKATKETVSTADVNRLPQNWLGNGVGNHETVVNALWALRNYMLKEALNISSIL